MEYSSNLTGVYPNILLGIATSLLNTTTGRLIGNQSSSLLAVAARLLPSFLSIRLRNRMLKLSIYANLGMDLDYILPFTGIPENSREIDGLDDKSKLAHGMMLVNLLRIFGSVKNRKASRHFVTRPTQVIHPLSPNHGLFRKDGLYSDSQSKILPLERKLDTLPTMGF